jgi:tetratricopeptide (TPR) repeat protein
MFRVTSLTEMPEAKLNRLIKRIGLLLFVGLIAFVAFYAFDRFRISPAPIVDQQLVTAEEAVRADPADVIARGKLADAYLQKGRYEEAIAQYTVLIDAGKEEELASLGRAQAYQKTGQYDLAIPDFQRVVDIASEGEMAGVDPVLASAFYGLGQIAMAQGKPAEAIEPFAKALTIQRTDADILYALSEAYIAIDQPDPAIERLTLAVALVPVEWPEAYTLLATAYTEKGDSDHAAWATAMATFAAGDSPTAEQQLRTMTDGPVALEATIGLGYIAEMAGDNVAATDWYRKALAIDPENEAAQMGVARVADPVASPSEGSN